MESQYHFQAHLLMETYFKCLGGDQIFHIQLCYIFCDLNTVCSGKQSFILLKSHKNRHILSKIGQQFNLLLCISYVNDHVYKNPRHSSFKKKENFQSRSLTKGVLSTLVDSVMGEMHTHMMLLKPAN